jgi:hypothetical protein
MEELVLMELLLSHVSAPKDTEETDVTFESDPVLPLLVSKELDVLMPLLLKDSISVTVLLDSLGKIVNTTTMIALLRLV